MLRPASTIALCSLLLAGCAGDVAVRAVASAPASASPTPCAVAAPGSHGTHTETESARYDSPMQAAAAYHRWQAAFDVIIAVPEDGYVVHESEDGRSALMRSGDVELDALKEDAGWRIATVRACA
jgi:hypothetical protein